MQNAHSHEGLQLGRLGPRAAKLGSRRELSCVKVYTLGADTLGLQIWDLAQTSLACGRTTWKLPFLGHGVGLSQRVHLRHGIQLGGLHSRAMDLGSGEDVAACMHAYSLGGAIPGHGFVILQNAQPWAADL